MTRLSFEFNGTTSRCLTLDPSEFKGQPIAAVTNAILKTMKDIAPDISYFPEEIGLAACQVYDAAARL